MTHANKWCSWDLLCLLVMMMYHEADVAGWQSTNNSLSVCLLIDISSLRFSMCLMIFRVNTPSSIWKCEEKMRRNRSATEDNNRLSDRTAEHYREKERKKKESVSFVFSFKPRLLDCDINHEVETSHLVRVWCESGPLHWKQ